MFGIILTLHVIVCALVILIVLVQSGKGAGLSGIFGSGGGEALFSAPSGSSFLKRMTTGLAAAFFLTSLTLTYLSARQGLRSVTRGAWNQAQPMPKPLPAPASESQAPAPAERPANSK